MSDLQTLTDEEMVEFFQSAPERPANIDDMKAEEPNLDGPYDQELRAKIEALQIVQRAERGRVICEEALRTINGERQDAYGNPEDTFQQIAALWEAYLGTEITPPIVADMMQLLKIAREKGGKGKRDNLVDNLGYGLLAAVMRGYDA